MRCGRGRIFDVVVDLRRDSPTYADWEGVELDDERFLQLFVPVGFAHGFATLSDEADVFYKQTAYFDPAVERTIAWDDPEIGIEWPTADELVVSDRFSTVYGNGPSEAGATEDYCLSLIDYYEILEGQRRESAPAAAAFQRLRAYINRVRSD